MLCVEFENSGESGPRSGFEVSRVEVIVGGEGAKANLIPWNREKGEEGVLPMKVGSKEQWNLLYAVGFMRSPDDAPDGFLLFRDVVLGDATTNITGAFRSSWRRILRRWEKVSDSTVFLAVDVFWT